MWHGKDAINGQEHERKRKPVESCSVRGWHRENRAKRCARAAVSCPAPLFYYSFILLLIFLFYSSFSHVGTCLGPGASPSSPSSCLSPVSSAVPGIAVGCLGAHVGLSDRALQAPAPWALMARNEQLACDASKKSPHASPDFRGSGTRTLSPATMEPHPLPDLVLLVHLLDPTDRHLAKVDIDPHSPPGSLLSVRPLTLLRPSSSTSPSRIGARPGPCPHTLPSRPLA